MRFKSYILLRPAVILIFIAGLFFSCKQAVDPITNVSQNRLELLSTDSAFSALSAKAGMKQAFIEFMDADGILLRPGYNPIIGANAVDFLIQQNDTSYTITWQPQHAVVANAGDLGYTYGIYQLLPHAMDTTLYGTYVSIWKKQKDSSWKFVLNTGNEGIGINQN